MDAIGLVECTLTLSVSQMHFSPNKKMMLHPARLQVWEGQSIENTVYQQPIRSPPISGQTCLTASAYSEVTLSLWHTG